MEDFDSPKLTDKKEILDTLEKLIEQTYKLEKENNNLKDIFNHLLEVFPQAIWVLNQDKSLFYFNSNAKKLEGMLSKVSNLLESEIEFNKENYLVQVNPTDLNRTIITATNITKEKRKERLASMGQISAHLAHEIRNPVGAISLMASSLIKKLKDDDKVYILEMQKAIWRLERLINATLLFSKGVHVRSSYLPSSIIKECIDNALNHLENRDDVIVNYSIKSKQIYCDYGLLNVILQNLLFNAIECHDEQDEDQQNVDKDKEKIKIKVEFFIQTNNNINNNAIKADEYQILRFFDNGPKVPITEIDTLFEAFKSSKVKGSGLGLPLSKQIARAHKGELEYKNDKLGKYFELRLKLV